MNKLISIGAAACMLFAGPVLAADEWGIEGEEKLRVTATVVDLVCEVAGDCVPECGGGKRQLGLLLEDGTLVPVLKNFDIFAGATDDLIGFCGQKIVADGLMIKNDKMNIYALQFKRLAPDGKWSRANQWGKNWSAANGGQNAGQWFKSDAAVAKTIKDQGVFGIPGLKPEE